MIATVGAEAEVAVERIATGGEGVARLPDGRVVFVPRTAPGDRAVVRLRRLAPRWARGELTRLLAAGPDRVAPRCAHYDGDGCGGCQLQHLTGPAQLAAKRTIVGDVLRRLGGLEVADPDIEPAPRAWGYRQKVTLTRDARGHLGFHVVDRPDRTFDLDRCEIADPRLNALWARLRGDPTGCTGGAGRVVLRVDAAGGLHVVLAEGRLDGPGSRELAAWLARGEPPARLWWGDDDGVHPVGAAASDGPPPTTFEQVAPEMGQAIRAWAVSALGDLAGRHAWDLYAGVGDTTRLLARAGATVESVELDAAAVAAGPSGAGITRHAGRVEALLGRLRPAAVAVANPPRTGLAPGATVALTERGPSRLAYVSCDPATLARDLRRLAPYRVAAVRAFDLFPQTAHVETVAVLERRR